MDFYGDGVTIQQATSATTYLLLFTLTLQLIELFVIAAGKNFQVLWTYKNLYEDLEAGLPLPRAWIRKLFSDSAIMKILILNLTLVATCFFIPHLYFFGVIFLCQVYICIRFRGSLNGGSDMMTFVLITGVILMHLFGARIGLIYISVHTIYSYLKAGLAKAKHLEWWNGNALPTFLHRSLYTRSHLIADWLEKSQRISRVAGILTVLFELSAIALLFFPDLVWIYFSAAVLFHLVVYFTFGLNRFFWAWMSAWPATIFCISSISQR